MPRNYGAERHLIESGPINFLVTFFEDVVPKRLRMNLVNDLHNMGQAIVNHAKGMLGHYNPGWPALSPRTVAIAGADSPLLRTTDLYKSIYYVVDESALVCRIGSNNLYAEFHELGTAHEPPRPFLRPSIEAIAKKDLPLSLKRALGVSFEVERTAEILPGNVDPFNMPKDSAIFTTISSLPLLGHEFKTFKREKEFSPFLRPGSPEWGEPPTRYSKTLGRYSTASPRDILRGQVTKRRTRWP